MFLARALFGLFGLAALVGVACLFSSDRRAIAWRTIPVGVALQILGCFVATTGIFLPSALLVLFFVWAPRVR